MSDAITLFFAFWSQILNFIFVEMEIVPGVSVGYVLIVIIILGLLINVLVSRPKGGKTDE